MSTWFAEQLACTCGHEFTARLARGIHASRVPQVREQILRNELHVITCPACGAIADIHRDLTYADFDRFHWVRVARPDELDAWAALEAASLAQFTRIVASGAPLVAELAERFRVRIVFDLDELRERLILWDAGLDDAVIECVKLRCLREPPARAPKTDHAHWTVPAEIVTAVAAERWFDENVDKVGHNPKKGT
ncbi:MAG TPA: CpXC domain-containing protein [Kofleriaceae bacterium]|nr:CpXC domain-containing protein [Kofleriaceae bacterium]